MSIQRRIFEYIVYVGLLLGSLFGIYFSLTQIGIDGWGITILCLAIGFFLSNFVYIFIHELGHLIGGLVGRFKFHSFSVLFFKFIKINGKTKIRFAFSKDLAGYCQMIPSASGNLMQNFSKFVKGAKISSMMFLTVMFAYTFAPLIFPEFFADKFALYACLAPAFASTFPTHVSNFSMMVSNPTTDGAVLRGIKANSETAKTQVKMLSIQSLLFSGTRPRDLDPLFFENLSFSDETKIYAPLFESYKLSHYLDLKDYEKVIASSDYIKATFRDTNEVFHKLLLADVFYVELVLKKNIEEAERLYFYIASLIKSHTDISTLRIRMAKEIFIDKAYSQALNTGVKAKGLAESYEAQGGGEMECDIINELSAIARKEKELELANADIDFKPVF